MQQCLEARIGILVTQQDINFLLKANCNSQIQNLSQSKPELFSFFSKASKQKQTTFINGKMKMKITKPSVASVWAVLCLNSKNYLWSANSANVLASTYGHIGFYMALIFCDLFNSNRPYKISIGERFLYWVLCFIMFEYYLNVQLISVQYLQSKRWSYMYRSYREKFSYSFYSKTSFDQSIEESSRHNRLPLKKM